MWISETLGEEWEHFIQNSKKDYVIYLNDLATSGRLELWPGYQNKGDVPLMLLLGLD